MSEAPPPVNTEQARAWDGPEGDNWVEAEEVYNAAVRYLTPRLLEAVAVQPHERILDIGCGCGETTRLAARAASGGAALGIDLSSRMIERARERAVAEGLANLRFERGDAQLYEFEPATFDVAMSRFGSTFFDDPVTAFGNIARALKPEGRVVMLCWRDLRLNEWISALRDALAAGRDLPEPPPGAPSPFAFADPDRVREVLRAAGFVDVGLDALEEPLWFGPDATAAFASIMRLGIVGGLLRDLDEQAREHALEALRATLAAHEEAQGVHFASSAWLVIATTSSGRRRKQ